MKPSHRNTRNAQAKADKLKAGPPVVSKYAAKQMQLKGKANGFS